MQYSFHAVTIPPEKRSRRRLLLEFVGRAFALDREFFGDRDLVPFAAFAGAVRDTDGTVTADITAGGAVVESHVGANGGDGGVAAHEKQNF